MGVVWSKKAKLDLKNYVQNSKMYVNVKPHRKDEQ